MENTNEKWTTFLQLIIFMIVYFLIFQLLENTPQTASYDTAMAVDRFIPFNEGFVLPYISWFLWIPFSCLYLFRTDEDMFRKACLMLMGGMTVFLIISAAFPTQLSIRPMILSDNGILCTLVDLVYRIDTPTNVFPSIHVFNTCVVLRCLLRSRGKLAQKQWFRRFAIIQSILICMSTLLIKQHSMMDVIGGIALYFVSVFVVITASGRAVSVRPAALRSIQKAHGSGYYK